MIDHFLRYSIRHQRRIMLMVQTKQGIRRITVQVLRADENSITYTRGKAAKEYALPLTAVLAAAYARGDTGDTLQNEQEACNAQENQATACRP